MLENLQLNPRVYVARSIQYTDERENVSQMINTSVSLVLIICALTPLHSYTLPADQTLSQLDPIQIAQPQFKAAAEPTCGVIR